MEPILSTAQRLDAAEKALVAANEQLTTANASLESSRAETVSANGTITSLNADLATAKAIIESLNTELATAKSSLATAQAESANLRAKEQDVEKRASARLQQMQAAIGISPPLPTGPASGAAQGKPNPAAGLTGLERAIAAHKANPVS